MTGFRGQEGEVAPLDERTRGLGVIVEVGSQICATLELPQILQASVDGVTTLVGLDTAAAYLIEGESLRLMATTPALPPDFPDHLRFADRVDHPSIERAVVSRKPLLIPDFRQSCETPAERQVAKQRDLRTVLIVPMVAGEQVFGVFIVGSQAEPTRISPLMVDLSLTLANVSALGVRNSQLFLDQRTHATELQALLEARDQAEREQARLQAQLIQAQKMESVGRLAGGVAHDFNNMLSIILGTADLALLRVDGDGELQRDLEQIVEAAGRSAELTRQLLAFARRQSAEPKVLDLNQTIEDLLRMLRRLMGEDVELAFRPDPEIGPVKLDPTQVDQILANLCVNARDAIGAHGKILLETGECEFDEAYCETHPEALPGSYVMVAVSDTGVGMAPEVQAHIFEPYFSTKEAGKGTGLGLSTVYGIVRQNHGLLHVYSEPGVGTTLRLYFRRHEGRDAEGPVRSPSSAQTGSETLLLVEDEEMILRLARQMLEGLGYVVHSARHPEEALEILRRDPTAIDLLITDVVMPGMNGRELAARAAGHNPDLETLYLSGYTADVIAENGILREGVRLLSKPFSRLELASRVREALDGS